ncbi:MAG: thioredoxin domain-containing protein [Anaerolineae bacterium]|nr:DsbA family protein [Anaerolineae bacterium]MDW8100650.1 thioredoxin domain-containing protein [Anaerolineae bacterium]
MNHHRLLRSAILLLTAGILVGLTGCGRDRAQPSATTPAPPAGQEASEITATRPATTAETTPTRVPRLAETSQEGLKPLPPTGEVDGIPVGFTQDGHAYRGNPEAAVVMVEYSEFQCPFCGRHERMTAPQIREAYIQTGKVLHIFRDFPLENIHAQARKAAEAARCAGEQGAEQFWAMHDLLFERADQWAEQPDAADRFKSYARELQLDHEVFNECLDSGRTSPAIDADLKAGLAQGVQGTPTFFLNGYPIVGAQPFTAFQAVIDALLAGNPPPTPQPSAQIPYWATAEGMSPDPERPGYTRAGDAFLGSSDAQVVILEFSDFQ